MAPLKLLAPRRREWLAASLAFLMVMLSVTATAGTAKADGAKQGGDLAGVLATESKPMETPRPKPKAVAKATSSAHAKSHHAPKAKHGKHAGAMKAAKTKPAKGTPKAPAKRGPKLRA